MRLRKSAGILLLAAAAAVTSAVRGGHSRVPLHLSMQLRVFDPKYDSAEHGKGITVNSAVGFRHGDPIRLVNGGESDLPEFDEPLQFGTVIEGDERLQNDRTVLVNIKLLTSSRYSDERQRDVHLVNGQLIHVCCAVTLGKARTIHCSDGRSLEILVERQT